MVSMTPVQVYARRILARWRLVAVLTAVGAVAAGVWSVTSLAPSWTATSALTTQSQNRAPDQDAVLALGYVDYFNQPSYQELLRSEVAIPAGVELTATTGATSPILYVQATGRSEDAVRAAATAATDRFQQDVRQSLVTQRTQAVGDLQKQIDDYVGQLQTPGKTDAEKSVVSDQIQSLQGQITEIQSDNTNLLKPLQPEPGVASTSSSPVIQVITGALGGAVLGILVALLLSVLDRRVGGATDVRQRLAAEPVIELGKHSSAAERAVRTEQLANRLSLGGSPDSTVIAVVGVREGSTAPVFARQLAGTYAARRSGALLVLADLRRKGYEGRMGLAEVLDGWTSPRSAMLRVGGLEVLPPGSAGARDPYAVVEPRQVVRFLTDAGRNHPVVVIDAPPLLDASESQILCAAADQVVLVVEPGQTSLADARQALELLAEAKANVAGVAVIAAEPDDRGRPEPVEIGDGRSRPIAPRRPIAPAGAADDLTSASERTVMLEVQAPEPTPVPEDRTVTLERPAPPATNGSTAPPATNGSAKPDERPAAEPAEPAVVTEDLAPDADTTETARPDPRPAAAEPASSPATRPVRPLTVPPIRGGADPSRSGPVAVPDLPAARPEPTGSSSVEEKVERAAETADRVEERPVAVNESGPPVPRPRPRPQSQPTVSSHQPGK
jgi:Mrp family chromosome partitioning ATPase